MMQPVTPWAGRCLLVLALLGGCAPTAPTATPLPATSTPVQATYTPVPATPSAAPATATPSPTAAALPEPIANDAGLTIVENEIKGKVEIEPTKFTPVAGTQDQVMARYAEKREDTLAHWTSSYDASGPVMSWNTGEGEYKVRQIVQAETEPARTTVTIEHDGEVIFEVDAGEVSPLNTVQGFWVEDGHWMLEINRVANRTEGNTVYSDTTGEIYRDGVLLNEPYGYDEMFNFQMMGGKPFYFYREGGKVRASYDGQTLPVEYDRIPHYACCSGAALNPVGGANWVGFFAQRGETWYYTEIGLY